MVVGGVMLSIVKCSPTEVWGECVCVCGGGGG